MVLATDQKGGMTNSLYRDILRKAWNLSWNNKKLWVFGFFAAFLQTSAVIEVLIRAAARFEKHAWSPLELAQNAYPGAPFVGTLSILGTNGQSIASVVFPIILILIIAVFFLWLFSSAEAALISAGAQKIKTSVQFDKSFAQGKKHAWQVLFINVVAKALIALFFLATAFPLIWMSQFGTMTNTIISYFTFLVFFPLALIVSFLAIYTVIAVVVHKEHSIHAMHHAWDVFRKNWIVSIEMALILFVIQLLAGVAIALFALILFFPVVILGLGAILVGTPIIFTALIVIALIILIVTIIATGSLVSTFQILSWTMLYEKIKNVGAMSKIVSFLKAVPAFFTHRG